MQVSVLGFGGSEIGYENADPATVERLLGSALDAGLNVIDTAECYRDSEELIGKTVSIGEPIFICSPNAATHMARKAARIGRPIPSSRASRAACAGCKRTASIWSSCTVVRRRF